MCEEQALPFPPLALYLFQGRPSIYEETVPTLGIAKASVPEFSSFPLKLLTSNYFYSPNPLFFFFSRPLEYPKFKIESVTFWGLMESRSLFLVFKGEFGEHSVRCPGEKAVIFNLQHQAKTIFKRARLPFLKPRIRSSK